MSDTDAAMRRLGRRLLLAIACGRVTGVTDTGNVQTMQVQLGDDEVRDNTPRPAEFGFSSLPPVGSDAVIIFVGGDRSNGVVVATGNQTLRMKAMSPGETAIYDASGKHVYLSKDGIVIEAKGQPVTVNNASQVTINATAVTINASTTLNGDVTVNGAIKATGDIIGSGHSLTGHKHGNVKNGNDQTGAAIG
ncbi:MAG: phage baseplate assembly protein V [Clostridiaceae bacterium]|nr:phage baseplate assembly protein V [Clostridiaceae bacterium]